MGNIQNTGIKEKDQQIVNKFSNVALPDIMYYLSILFVYMDC